jgi:hypothetical protein
MVHVNMFGSDGYPVSKAGRGWVWREAFGVNGSPIVYKTKRAAVAAFEAWCDVYRIRYGEERQVAALAELEATR